MKPDIFNTPVTIEIDQNTIPPPTKKKEQYNLVLIVVFMIFTSFFLLRFNFLHLLLTRWHTSKGYYLDIKIMKTTNKNRVELPFAPRGGGGYFHRFRCKMSSFIVQGYFFDKQIFEGCNAD